MLNKAFVLVVEDQAFIALDLALAIEDAGGQVVGPAASVKEALALLATTPVGGAILDINLIDGDCLPVMEVLESLGVPMVVQTGMGVPPSIAARFPGVFVKAKPCESRALVAELATFMVRLKPRF